tara:strand:+ start:137 stop:262 length:126 start_codon:yes stop_codon:yes gene_type:complete
MKKEHEEQLNCGCGFLWSQFVEAGIDELVNYCPTCGEKVIE